MIETDVKKSISLEEYSTYYPYDFYCTNCGERNHVYIKKGLRNKEVHVECDNCGCKI